MVRLVYCLTRRQDLSVEEFRQKWNDLLGPVAKRMAEFYGASNTSAIPTGVDVEYYLPGEDEAEGNNLIFTGSMDWLPNEDAMIFFTEQILPRIRRELDVKLWIVGRNPTPAVRKLAR